MSTERWPRPAPSTRGPRSAPNGRWCRCRRRRSRSCCRCSTRRRRSWPTTRDRGDTRVMQTAVVTGAGQGLGKATAQRLAADGWHVVAVDVDGAKAEVTATETGGSARRVDVRDRDAVQELAAALDACDALVNNAGIWRFAGLRDITEED